MEQWRPLFELFLSSPLPESAAAWWFQSQHQPNSPPLTSSFLNLLLSPVPSSSLVFIHTLPPFIQSRILSFLSSYRFRYDSLQLHSVAIKLVGFGGSDFWVKHVACNLLDEMPEGSLAKDSFFDLPPWLREASSDETPVLPWRPFDKPKLPEKRTKHSDVLVKTKNLEPVSPVFPSALAKLCPILSGTAIERAMELKTEIRTVETVPETIALSEKIQNMCIETQNSIDVLSLIEPWEINDDLTRVLLSNILIDDGSSLILSSILLPKLLNLQTQPLSLIISTTLEFCKKHPVEAVNSLLLPLIFRKQGLNITLCDLITKVTKDCMHPVHVSFFIQRLIYAEEYKEIKPTCFPWHLELISNELVWNDSLFQLLYNMINRDKDVILTPDSVEKLVSVIGELASNFAKSLKFGSFVLCFVNKCGDKLTSHKHILEKAAEKTDTFVTKAILVRGHNLSNAEIIVADISKFQMERSFDRILSIEMFEHMKNYKELLKKISGWMKPDGLLFVHHFCHKTFAYHFEDKNEDDWITRYFFTGGTMPVSQSSSLFSGTCLRCQSLAC